MRSIKDYFSHGQWRIIVFGGPVINCKQTNVEVCYIKLVQSHVRWEVHVNILQLNQSPASNPLRCTTFTGPVVKILVNYLSHIMHMYLQNPFRGQCCMVKKRQGALDWNPRTVTDIQWGRICLKIVLFNINSIF